MTLIDDILDGLRLQSSVFTRMTLAGDWGFAKTALNGAPFHLVLSGQACLRPRDGSPPQMLQAGDIVVLPNGDPHLLSAGPASETTPFQCVARDHGLAPWSPGRRYKSIDLLIGSGETTATMISGIFAFGDPRRNPLLRALPSVLFMRADGATPTSRALRTITALLDAELSSGLAGSETVAARLADILFIQVVRHHLASAEHLPQGWLRGVTDREVAPAIALMHREPEQNWSVASIAQAVGMSRSRFAARFHEVVGQSPLEYLTQWRMFKAAGHLAEPRAALPAVAAAVGYRSEVSFSKAFKRWAGRSPADYRRGLQDGELIVLASPEPVLE